MKKSFSWVFMHTLLITIVVINLLTGFRIASSHRAEVLPWSALLPQGSLHGLHFILGFTLLALMLSYVVYQLIFLKRLEHNTKSRKRSAYYQLIIYLGYISLSLLAITGLGLYFNLGFADVLLDFHYFIALVVLLYIPLHAGSYFIQYGNKLLIATFKFTPNKAKNNTVFVSFFLVTFGLLYYLFPHNAPTKLTVHSIDLSTKIAIDGIANEDVWADIEPLHIKTFGGANFVNGASDVAIKVVENGIEAFFNISWQDSSESYTHLPLKKTESGWKVLENGFYRNDEQTYYEDKFAVILSNNCAFSASNTAHLGPKPLADKPSNWHGKGYHYTTDNSIVDLWQWKAVRTNDMMLMDDNYIGAPDKALAGKRRYTAGYKTDGKRSGAYVMNWLWYTPNGVTPKRLPMTYDDNKLAQTHIDKSWLLPWYDAKPYSVEQDTLAIGSILPSVLHLSNSFEGDRADVRAFATYQNGRWSMELSRKLTTGSQYDIALENDVCLWVAAFDHSQTAHTRHARPLQLAFNKGKSDD
ncbi:ethylbenzene dehydrogenase-related protein [Thalassotalea sp. PLHSN55]|uniref:ethylbenzene dehydrogenase-related protein n=1 Tax=Thalassotalea sp. PLHSN55 TaxID=3435888 RepID=UPI003F85A213